MIALRPEGLTVRIHVHRTSLVEHTRVRSMLGRGHTHTHTHAHTHAHTHIYRDRERIDGRVGTKRQTERERIDGMARERERGSMVGREQRERERGSMQVPEHRERERERESGASLPPDDDADVTDTSHTHLQHVQLCLPSVSATAAD